MLTDGCCPKSTDECTVLHNQFNITRQLLHGFECSHNMVPIWQTSPTVIPHSQLKRASTTQAAPKVSVLVNEKQPDHKKPQCLPLTDHK
jgi:hypothetical protein